MKTIKKMYPYQIQDPFIFFVFFLFTFLISNANAGNKYQQISRIGNYSQISLNDNKFLTLGKNEIIYSNLNYNLIIFNHKNNKSVILEYLKNNNTNYVFITQSLNSNKFFVSYYSKNNIKLDFTLQNPMCSKNVSELSSLINKSNIIDLIAQINMNNLFSLDTCKDVPSVDLKKIQKLINTQLNLKYSFLSNCLENPEVAKIVNKDPILSIAMTSYVGNYIQLVKSLEMPSPNLKMTCSASAPANKIASLDKTTKPPKLVFYSDPDGLRICKNKDARAIFDHEIFHFGAKIIPVNENTKCGDEVFAQYFTKLCDPSVDFAKLESSRKLLMSCQVKKVNVERTSKREAGLAPVATATIAQARTDKENTNKRNANALAEGLNRGNAGKALIGQLTAVPGSKEVTAALGGLPRPRTGDTIPVPQASFAPLAEVGSRLNKLGDTLLAAATKAEKPGGDSQAMSGTKPIASFVSMGLDGVGKAFGFESDTSGNSQSPNSDEPLETSPKLDSPRLASRSNGSSSNSGSGPSSGLVSGGRGPASVSIKSVVVGDAGLPNPDSLNPSDSPSQHDVVVVPKPQLVNAKSPSTAQAQPSNPAQVAKGINTPASAKPSAVASNSANVDNRIATGGVVSPNDSSSTGGAINGGSSKGIVQKAKAKPSNVATESGPVKPSRGIASIANGTGQFTSSNLQNSNPINGNDTSKAIKAFSMAKVIKGETYTKLRTTLLEPDNLIKSPSQAQLKQQLKKQLVQQGIFIYNAESQKAIVGDIQKASRCFKDSTVDKQFIKMECSDIKLMK